MNQSVSIDVYQLIIINWYHTIDEQSIMTWKWFVFVIYQMRDWKEHFSPQNILTAFTFCIRRVITRWQDVCCCVRMPFPVINLSRLQVHVIEVHLKFGFHFIFWWESKITETFKFGCLSIININRFIVIDFHQSSISSIVRVLSRSSSQISMEVLIFFRLVCVEKLYVFLRFLYKFCAGNLRPAG